MIRKLIGILVVVAVVVIVVIAAIRRDNFRSMVLRDEMLNQTYPAGPVSDAAETPAITDTLPGSSTVVDGVVIETDSTTVVFTDSLPAQR